jgi:hypothetical protein
MGEALTATRNTGYLLTGHHKACEQIDDVETSHGHCKKLVEPA